MSALDEFKKYRALFESATEELVEKKKTKKKSKTAWTDTEEVSESCDDEEDMDEKESEEKDDLKESLSSIAKKLLEEFGKAGKWRDKGKEWKTKVFDTDAAANKFMETNDGWGVIGEKDGEVHVARNDDDGKPINERMDDFKAGMKRMWHGTDDEAYDQRDTEQQYDLMKGDSLEKEKLDYAKKNGSIVYDSERFVVFEFGDGISFQAFDKYKNYESVISSNHKHPHLAKIISHAKENGNYESIEKSLTSYFDL